MNRDEPQRDTLNSLDGVAEGVASVEAIDNADEQGDGFWIGLARDAYTDSTTWLDSAVRKQWEKNVAHFNNRFAPGSKYNSPNFRKRSRVFRPKTRASVRNNEAALAAALFSTDDLLTIQAENDQDPRARASAKLNHALLEYRLTKSVPWFLTAMGAFQDTQVYGACISYQYWRYEEREVEVSYFEEGIDPEKGELTQVEKVTKTTEVVKDKPCIDLMPPENLRIHPGADWRDPIDSSPYVIRMVPMYAGEVMERMSRDGDDHHGQQKWIEHSLGSILTARTNDDDSTRRAREDNRPDSSDADDGYFATVWCHENFIRINGEEWVYWTLGQSLLLSEPQPLSEVYFHGKRPIVMGYSNLEAHKTYPTSHVQMVEGLQEATNAIQNQRFDNVELVLNKRYLLRRGQQIDTPALMRNVPGGAVVTTDPDKDVRVLEWNDVTGSSYQEQDRLDIQIDDMMGSFSQASVSNNRQLNETVGGMNLMNSSASAVTEYTIRTFCETWVEPVLRQLLLLEQHYESDSTTLALAAGEAELAHRFGVNEIDDELIKQQLHLTVNVGIGATNPQQKVERLMFGINSVAGLPGVIEKANSEEIISEVFGSLGYKNGQRFFTPPERQEDDEDTPPSPEMQLAQQQAALQKQEMAFRERELGIKEFQAQSESDARMQKQADDRELGFAKLASQENMTMAQLQAKLEIDLKKDDRHLQLEAMKDKTKRDTTALTERNKQAEMMLKQETGSGI